VQRGRLQTSLELESLSFGREARSVPADECSNVVSGGHRNSESFGREARSVPADECSDVVSGGHRNSESFGREAHSVPPEVVGTWRVSGERHILYLTSYVRTKHGLECLARPGLRDETTVSRSRLVSRLARSRSEMQL